jgi:hypothetical protein
MSFDIFVSLFHPNLICYYLDANISFSHKWFLLNITYEVNSLLLIVTLLRVYIICRFLLVFNEFYSARAARVISIFGKKLSKIFVMRCMLLVKPVRTILTMALISILSISCMIKIVEGPNFFTYDHIAVDFSLMVNSIWSTTITMTTVGYGDLPPSTLLGRCIMFLASLVGTILISFMMMSLQNYFKLNENEIKANKEYNVEQIKLMLTKYSARFFFASYRYFRNKSKYYNAIKEGVTDYKKLSKLKNDVLRAIFNKLEYKKDFSLFLK